MFLRLGISNNYNFEQNLNTKFSNLRTFIKGQLVRIHWDKDKNIDVESLLPLVNSEGHKEPNQ